MGRHGGGSRGGGRSGGGRSRGGSRGSGTRTDEEDITYVIQMTGVLVRKEEPAGS